MSPQNSILTVIGKDRPGIIAAVTEVLFRRGCNLEDVSMTILEGELSMMMVVSLPAKKKRGIEKGFTDLKKKGLTFFWKDLHGKLVRGESRKKNHKLYLISAAGEDRTGIVYRVSRTLAEFGMNITDLNSKILDSGRRTSYVMMLEAEAVKSFPLKKLERSIERLGKELAIEIKMKPVERIEL